MMEIKITNNIRQEVHQDAKYSSAGTAEWSINLGNTHHVARHAMDVER